MLGTSTTSTPPGRSRSRTCKSVRLGSERCSSTCSIVMASNDYGENSQLSSVPQHTLSPSVFTACNQASRSGSTPWQRHPRSVAAHIKSPM